MPRISRGEFFEIDPDIERTFRERRKAQRALFDPLPPFLRNRPILPNPPNMEGPQREQPLLEQPHEVEPPPDVELPHVVGPQNVAQPRVAQPHVAQPRMGQPHNDFRQGYQNYGYEEVEIHDDDEPLNNEIPRPEPPNIINLANSKDGRIMDYAVPVLDQLNSGIAPPRIDAHHFELKPIMFHMLQTNGQFAGIPSEDPHAHLKSFMALTNTFKIPGVPQDSLRLTLFQFSLRDRARSWFDSLAPGSVTSWNSMAEKFLRKYFPPNRNAKSRSEICNFRQLNDEPIPESWERFKELLRRCPHHGIPYCIQLETFYNGLTPNTKQMLDATAGGAFTASTYNEGYDILEKISINNGHCSDPRAISATPIRSVAGSQDQTAITALAAQLASVTTLLQNLTSGHGGQLAVNEVGEVALTLSCVCCGGEHSYDCCPHNCEAVNYVQKNSNPYGNTYNAKWRQHPGFSWKEPCSNPPAPPPQGNSNFQNNQGNSNFQNNQRISNQNQGNTNYQNQQGNNQYRPGNNFQNQNSNFQNKQAYQNRQPQQAEPSTSMENWVKGFMTQTQASIRNLETQISQLAANQANRPAGTLPSNTEVPRAPGKEHVKAMALRNGKELEGPVPKTSETTPRKEFEPTFKSKSSTPLPTIFEEPEGPSQPIRNTEPIPEPVSISTQATPIGSYHSFKESLEKPPQKAKPTSSPEPACSTSKPVIKPVPLYVPYPQRLRNQKEELQFKKFLDVFKELHINIPFVEAIEQMPLYAKFLKDMLSKKKKLDDYETVALTEGYEALMTKNIPPKLKDPGCFTIPCAIGGKTIGKALCDLGASINLMPLSVFNSLSIGDVRPTSVTILLADKTIAYPKGKIEDILVQVDKFIFPADFIILDFEADKDIPILLGRPFLATARTLIDVQKGELTMRLLDQEITFNMFNSMKYPSGMEDCCALNDIESLCHEEGIEEACKLEEENTEELDLTDETVPMETAAFEILDNTEGKSFTPSIVSPPDLELKQLPSHLKYAFLGEQNKLPVIISSTLELHQEKKLVELLKLHTKAIGWTIADLKGISPSICQHKIILEEKDFTSVEPQRRLNPVMKEVVKKEILKWLDAGIIFPIAGSSWVSPVQCVPKKGGFTVVKNEKNELIPTRLVSGWRICMDYRRLNKATQKDHFPLPFIDQMLDRLAGKEYYCFLDGYSGYNQITLATGGPSEQPSDETPVGMSDEPPADNPTQEKTTAVGIEDTNVEQGSAVKEKVSDKFGDVEKSSQGAGQKTGGDASGGDVPIQPMEAKKPTGLPDINLTPEPETSETRQPNTVLDDVDAHTAKEVEVPGTSSKQHQESEYIEVQTASDTPITDAAASGQQQNAETIGDTRITDPHTMDVETSVKHQETEVRDVGASSRVIRSKSGISGQHKKKRAIAEINTFADDEILANIAKKPRNKAVATRKPRKSTARRTINVEPSTEQPEGNNTAVLTNTAVDIQEKRGAGPSTLELVDRPEMPFGGFSSKEAEQLFQKVKDKEGWVDSGFDDSSLTDYEFIREVVTRHKWDKLVKVRPPFNATLIQECYAEIQHSGIDQITLRGISVGINAEAINSLFGFKAPRVDKFNELFANISEEKLKKIKDFLGKPGTDWEPHNNLRLRKFRSCNLTPNANVWVSWLLRSLTPCSHESSLTCERMVLLYCVMTGKRFDVGSVIIKWISYCANRNQGKLFFPTLLHALLLRAGVPQYKSDKFAPLGKEKWSIDTKSVSRLLREKAATDDVNGMIQELLNQGSTILDTMIEQSISFDEKLETLQNEVTAKIEEGHNRMIKTMKKMKADMEGESKKKAKRLWVKLKAAKAAVKKGRKEIAELKAKCRKLEADAAASGTASRTTSDPEQSIPTHSE
ncbi:hypothetical protein OSB04_016409 [Centaurea solstitialis]|uniref:Retrotransposon gag domain-containing protein n=1 Tax=Centaurea solstitialis TaxID=347529 RepID=A0AA38WJP1_9ASTR|nr:hypothetical protein OSB04_016409 [Centaurea solstitialis]